MPTFQAVGTVNYPNEHAYTRITEFKHLTGQAHPMTSIVYEYPRSEGDPYYPIPRAENTALYQKYQAIADATKGVHFAGRLATYKYYNMDQVVAQALNMYSKIIRADTSVLTLTETNHDRRTLSAAIARSVGGNGVHS